MTFQPQPPDHPTKKPKKTRAQTVRDRGEVLISLAMRPDARDLMTAAAALSHRTREEWAVAILIGAARAAVNAAKTEEKDFSSRGLDGV